MRPLHPIQVKIIYLFWMGNTSVYKIAKNLNEPESKVFYHIKELTKKGFLRRIEKDGKVIYELDKRNLKIEKNKDKIFIFWKLPDAELQL